MRLLLAFFRYSLDINLTDEQVNHPLMREAEGAEGASCRITPCFVAGLVLEIVKSEGLLR